MLPPPPTPPARIGIVIRGSVSIETVVVSSFHDVLHDVVFHIISMITQGKIKHL